MNPEPFDTNLNEFVKKLFSYEPAAPFDFLLCPENDVPFKSVLLYIFKTGCEILYKKTANKLTSTEIEHLRKYILSVGYDLTIKENVIEKKVIDYFPDGKPYTKTIRTVKKIIDFEIANREKYAPIVQNYCGSESRFY